MSEPVTNVEIEDVLSSIRRLVSDGDKARTRDSAPEQEAVEPVRDMRPDPAEPESPAENTITDRLVLTPAFLVVDDTTTSDIPLDAADEDQDTQHEDQSKADQIEDAAADTQEQPDETPLDNDQISDDQIGDDASTESDDQALEPLELTNMVWDAPHQADNADEPDNQDVELIQTPDRSDLVATIAELEAAISTDSDEYEPDGSEMSDDEPMAQTIAWPRTFARKTEGVEEAEIDDEGAKDEAIETKADDSSSDADSRVMPFQRSTTGVTPVVESDTDVDVADDESAEEAPELEAPEVEADVYADDDLDDLIEAGGVTLDDEALRAMVADVVREELTGPLGERITRNVRKLVRREIYRVLSSQDFD